MRTTLVVLLFASIVHAQEPGPIQDDPLTRGAPGTGGSGERATAPDVAKMPFTPQAIRSVVSFHQPEIQRCYEQSMSEKQKVVKGKLQTSWVITGEGLVKDAKIDRKASTLHDKALHECVVTVLSAMTFPRPPDAKDRPVEYPFNL